MQKINPIYLIFLLIIGINFSSCVTHNELLNFSEGEPFPTSPKVIAELPELKIQPDDLLSIRVQALDLEAALPYNIDPLDANVTNLGAGNTRPLLGYLVDRNGYIDFPVLGQIKVGGLTTGEVRELLVSKLQPDYLKDPVVIVRYLNFRLTVLGEVASPGSFTVPTERMSIFDALGSVGGLSPYANRTNILISREQNGMRSFGRINLQDRAIFDSPFFFLQQNDFIYVEPLQERTASIQNQSQRILPYVSAGVTLITLVITLTTLNR